mmetsp:Transcript_9290/g.23029  ORF Transcript_9290/g.23029 Transcript_9290/m.23029 type:complete len:262 (-) Transcript_9290:1235-2020(-)
MDIWAMHPCAKPVMHCSNITGGCSKQQTLFRSRGRSLSVVGPLVGGHQGASPHMHCYSGRTQAYQMTSMAFVRQPSSQPGQRCARSLARATAGGRAPGTARNARLTASWCTARGSARAQRRGSTAPATGNLTQRAGPGAGRWSTAPTHPLPDHPRPPPHLRLTTQPRPPPAQQRQIPRRLLAAVMPPFFSSCPTLTRCSGATTGRACWPRCGGAAGAPTTATSASTTATSPRTYRTQTCPPGVPPSARQTATGTRTSRCAW